MFSFWLEYFGPYFYQVIAPKKRKLLLKTHQSCMFLVIFVIIIIIIITIIISTIIATLFRHRRNRHQKITKLPELGDGERGATLQIP